MNEKEDIVFSKEVYEVQKCISPSAIDQITVFVVYTTGYESLLVLRIGLPRMLGSQFYPLQSIIVRWSSWV